MSTASWTHEHADGEIWVHHPDFDCPYGKEEIKMPDDERRCMLCGYPQSEHKVHVEMVELAGRKAIFATGWDCPRAREIIGDEDKFLK